MIACLCGGLFEALVVAAFGGFTIFISWLQMRFGRAPSAKCSHRCGHK